MRVCFVSRGTVDEFCSRYGGADAEVIFFGVRIRTGTQRRNVVF